MEKFFSKIRKGENEDDCWIWLSNIDKRDKYGKFYYLDTKLDAHVASFLIHNKNFEYLDLKGMVIMHSCDVPACVNPKHLFLGTYSDNAQDAYNKGRMKVPIGYVFKDNHVPNNCTITREIAQEIKNKIKNRTGSLKELATELGLSEYLVRDISAGRVYKVT